MSPAGPKKKLRQSLMGAEVCYCPGTKPVTNNTVQDKATDCPNPKAPTPRIHASLNEVPTCWLAEKHL